MKKLTALLLIAAMLCGTFAGCGSKEEEAYVPTGDALLMEGQDPEEYLGREEEEQELVLAYNPDRSMNPLVGYSQNNRVLFSLIYQGLFTLNSSNEPTPILCSGYQVNASNTVWTFYLEENARFSDGSKVTVDDVIASYAAARESDYYKGRFAYYLSDIKPSSDGGVDFYLNVPFQDLPILLDVPIVKAEDVNADSPRGSGPYTFSSGLSGAHMAKVFNWWADLEIPARADTITLIPAGTDAQIRDEFEFGDVSLVIANPMSDSYADYRCDFELWEVDSGVFLYLGCNVMYSDYFEDGVLRQILTYAIDREKLIEKNYRGHAIASTLAVSPKSIYYNEALASKYAYDSMKFIDAISVWNVPNRNDPEAKLKLLVNSDDSARLRMARDIAQTLTEFGIPTGTLECSGSNYVDVLKANNWDIYLGQTRLPANYDLSEFFRIWGGLSWGGLPNETILGKCKDTLENNGVFYNLLELVANDGRIVPVAFGYHAVYAERGVFENLAPARDNVFYYSMGKTMDSIRIETVYE